MKHSQNEYPEYYFNKISLETQSKSNNCKLKNRTEKEITDERALY